MVTKIERRSKTIEEIRNNYLKLYFENDKQKVIDNSSMQSLGLGMYADNNNIQKILYNAFCKSSYDKNIIMHPQQIECLNYLLKGDNMLISAPTSFGKTFVALEYISRKDFNNIAFVVPTLALMNELLIKIKNAFGNKYNIVQNSYECTTNKNIFIIVPERADVTFLQKIDYIDFLVFDEIYKLQRYDSNTSQDKRTISLNKGYFELVNKSNQTLLLGPFIKDIEFERTKLKDDITKYITDFAPVYTQIDFVEERDKFVLNELRNDNSKLIYFNSPNSIYEFSVNISANLDQVERNNSLTEWCDKYISDSWLPSKLLKSGIGIHHGRLPGFMRKYIENLYNSEQIHIILCTSTLLEGINTPTNELIIYDSANFSAFKLNNLIGRVGRLNSFKKGQVYLFDHELEGYLLDDSKYEEIQIVAESSDVTDLEEVIYLDKDISELDEKNLDIYHKLNETLKIYNKNIEDLENTDGFIVSELIDLCDNLEDIFSNLKDFEKALVKKDGTEQTKIRGKIIEIFMGIIPHKRSYMLREINKNLPENKIKSSVCVSKLLNLSPKSIYDRIKNEINKPKDNMPENTLNLFIDYLFDLSFSYIKYDLSRIVSYFDFIFDEQYIQNNDDIEDLIYLLDNEILHRLRVLNNNNNLILKILIDLDIPYKDANEIYKIIKDEVDETHLSTSIVLDKLNDLFDKIIKNDKIESVTIDLLKILLQK